MRSCICFRSPQSHHFSAATPSWQISPPPTNRGLGRTGAVAVATAGPQRRSGGSGCWAEAWQRPWNRRTSAAAEVVDGKQPWLPWMDLISSNPWVFGYNISNNLPSEVWQVLVDLPSIFFGKATKNMFAEMNNTTQQNLGCIEANDIWLNLYPFHVFKQTQGLLPLGFATGQQCVEGDVTWLYLRVLAALVPGIFELEALHIQYPIFTPYVCPNGNFQGSSLLLHPVPSPRPCLQKRRSPAASSADMP